MTISEILPVCAKKTFYIIIILQVLAYRVFAVVGMAQKLENIKRIFLFFIFIAFHLQTFHYYPSKQ